MEAKLASDTKLWAEQKAMKLNIRKSKKEADEKAKLSKRQLAEGKLAAAEKVKAEVDKKLAKEKAEHEEALQKLEKEKAEMKQAKSDLEAASSKLQKLRGYTPALPAEPVKSGAAITPAVLS